MQGSLWSSEHSTDADRTDRQEVGLSNSNSRKNSKSLKWFIEDQASSLAYDLAPPPPPSPRAPVSKLDRWHTERLRKRDNSLTGRGWEWRRKRRKIIRRRESLVLHKLFNTLWVIASDNQKHYKSPKYEYLFIPASSEKLAEGWHGRPSQTAMNEVRKNGQFHG